jgi:hypothetical protein
VIGHQRGGKLIELVDRRGGEIGAFTGGIDDGYFVGGRAKMALSRRGGNILAHGTRVPGSHAQQA